MATHNQCPATIQSVRKFVEDASKEGLRTLLVAMKIVSQKQLEHFERQCSLAEENISTRDAELQMLYDEFERDLVVLGATAVEDRLQDMVPETLKDLISADIKVFMLTGDKLETAENIGKSCNLIQDDMNVLYIRSNDIQDLDGHL